MKFVFLLLFSVCLIQCGCSLPKVNSSAAPVDHVSFTALLNDHVAQNNGCVDYTSLREDSVRLNAYLHELETHHPNSTWTEDEQKAYWINAYNAFTLRLIIRNYPIESIKDLGGSLYKVNTPWDIPFITIEGAEYDLNDIEHSILRKAFDDPRIHFAINCASVSCPVLLNEAYDATRLDEQLDAAAVRFLNDPLRNQINASEAALSRIFLWFRGDFTNGQTLRAYLSRYLSAPISDDTKIKHLDYDWSLNDCP